MPKSVLESTPEMMQDAAYNCRIGVGIDAGVDIARGP